MFDTSQPNSDQKPSQNPAKRPAKGSSKRKPFKSIEEFSNWLDLQLEALEERHQDFQTSESNRHYFQR